MVGDWKSLLSNFGSTGPVPTMDRSLLVEGWRVGEGLENAAVGRGEGERLAAEAAVDEVVAAGGTGGGGELMVEAAGAIEEDERDWACLARFLTAALVCQPHEHGLFAEGWKNFPCRHFLIAAIAANASRFDGFCPLPSNVGRPSARSISCSAYCPRPRKWWDDFDMSEREPEIERPIATKSLPRT